MRLLLAIAALAAAAPALSAQAVAVSIEELTRASSAVVRGHIVGSHAELVDAGREVITIYDVRVDKVLRGKAPKDSRVIVPGGVVGKIGQRLDAAPRLATGEDVVLFLERAGADAFRITGLAQGKFSVVGSVARPDLSQLMFARTTVRPGERRSEEMPLTELERRVRSTK